MTHEELEDAIMAYVLADPNTYHIEPVLSKQFLKYPINIIAVKNAMDSLVAQNFLTRSSYHISIGINAHKYLTSEQRKAKEIEDERLRQIEIEYKLSVINTAKNQDLRIDLPTKTPEIYAPITIQAKIKKWAIGIFSNDYVKLTLTAIIALIIGTIILFALGYLH